eukprot:TRINITY_DN2899_c0_g1_i1.p1 TRINITY_DN2899_c0_g1~~TRINITY_DN2899_c0_g1_i1.p1  ORF type:complete len:96 (-),score=14.58 TRINITY_DN2899_c0_g1_i1:70-357(-)
MNQEGKTLVKEAGSVEGQQFLIDGCKECKIYIVDWTAQITVDCCTGCTIFLPPCESSVYLRDCTGCTVVSACQQLRLGVASDIDSILYCTTNRTT